MSDEIPSHLEEESRRLESYRWDRPPVHSAETGIIGGETLPDQPLSEPTGDSSELPPATEVAASSPRARVMVLGVAAAALAAFSGYQLLQAKESQRLLDEANDRATTMEISRKNLETDLNKSLSEKDTEIEEARADSQRLSENLAKEQEKNRNLQVQADKAAAAVQAKVRLAGELDSVKSTNRELAQSKAKAEAEVRRLSGGGASRKTSSSASKSTQRPPSAVERTVIQITSGPNKGRWHFVAADGFRSPLYGSREGALRDAELHARGQSW